jgi:anti-sigma28 factor (negative regulator of flagellin synthesis)
MKIIDQSNVSPSALPSAKGAGGVEPTGRRETAHATTGDGKDSAEVSGLAAKISEAIGKDNAGRAAKVEALRAQVASGSYQADAKATSHAIVNDAVSQAAGAGGSSQK